MSSTQHPEIVKALHGFGYESFRPGQERAIKALLAGKDVLAVLPTGSGKSLVYQLISQLLPGFDVRKVSLAAEERRKACEESRIDMMRQYAETRDCRRRFILNYFGEKYDGRRCGYCDNDQASGSYEHAMEPVVHTSPFSPGDVVVHERWGEGTVHRTTETEVTVLFDQKDYKTLDPQSVLDTGVLWPKKRAA